MLSSACRFPDTVATFGALLTLIGLVSSIGAWLQWAGPVSWSAGANFVLLLLEVVSFLSFVFDRCGRQEASVQTCVCQFVVMKCVHECFRLQGRFHCSGAWR